MFGTETLSKQFKALVFIRRRPTSGPGSVFAAQEEGRDR